MLDASLSSSANGIIPPSAAPENGTVVSSVMVDRVPAVTRFKISFIMICLLILE